MKQAFVLVINGYPQSVQRIFNESFNRGGRFYGAAWHNMPRTDREKIAINGNRTVELDFCSIHPGILYHKKGVDRPSRIYRIPKVQTKREINKTIFNAMLNSSSLSQAKRAIQSEINYGNITLPKQLSPSDVIQEILQFHPNICDSFFTGAGLSLQYDDSQIASEIISYFTNRKIPILTVHDSFISAEQHKLELLNQMIAAYQRRFNFTPRIEVKENTNKQEKHDHEIIFQ